MRYLHSETGFAFELPDGWREGWTAPGSTVTFYGQKGDWRAKQEIIQLTIGVPAPMYLEPAHREEYLREPGAEVCRTVFAGEPNAVEFKALDRTEMSVVRHGVHYSFSYSNDTVAEEAFRRLRQTVIFPSPRATEASLQEGPLAPALSRRTTITPRDLQPIEVSAIIEKYLDDTLPAPLNRLRAINLSLRETLPGPRMDLSRQLMAELAMVVRNLGELGGDDKIEPIIRALADGVLSYERDELPEQKQIVDAAEEALLAIGGPAMLLALERGALDSRPAMARVCQRIRRRMIGAKWWQFWR